MKSKLQAAVFVGMVLAGCKTEPSPAAGAGETQPAAPATPPASAPAAPPPAPAVAAPLAAAPPAGSGGQAASEEPSGRVELESFEDDAADAAPKGFSFVRTGKGAEGQWLVKSEAGAPSGAKVLAQVDTDNTNSRFALAVLEKPVVKDVRVSVRCKLVSGRVDQACGLVARYRDENNYFITRANALENNIRLYTLRDGKRTEIASHDLDVQSNVWYDYRFQLRGDHLEVFWNGERVIDHHDATFADAGKVGLWTKADSISHFDDLRVQAYE